MRFMCRTGLMAPKPVDLSVIRLAPRNVYRDVRGRTIFKRLRRRFSGGGLRQGFRGVRWFGGFGNGAFNQTGPVSA
jgi:hypothetical protein